MLIPEIMPDELATSFLQRIAAVNGYRLDKRFTEALFRSLGIASSSKSHVYLIRALAELTRMNPHEFIRQHTLVPYTRAISPVTYDIPGREKRPYWSEEKTDLSLLRDLLYQCPRCASDDAIELGFSYFRRQHQIPGIYQCAIHGSPLIAPTENSTVQNNKITELIHDNPVISRYAHISKVLLSQSQPLRELFVVAVLRARALDCGYGMSGHTRRPPLSTLALKLCPVEWLVAIEPKFGSPDPGNTNFVLDNAISWRYHIAATQRFVLAMALLFDSVDDAISEVSSYPIEEIPKLTPHNRRISGYLQLIPGSPFYLGYVSGSTL